MTDLRLKLFGGFDFDAAIETAGMPRKVKGLLAYLVLQPGRAQSRDKLATLLWANSSDSQARQSLRQALADLRKLLGGAADLLVCTNETVTLAAGAIDVDVLEFQQCLGTATAEALARAVELYHGDFLDGLYLRAPDFDDWRALEAGRLREQALGAIGELLEQSLASGATDAGVRLATRLLALDPLRESAHRALMRLYAQQGRHALALKQYRICHDVLRRDLGVEPEPATTALHDELRSGRMATASSGSAPASRPPAIEREPPAESADSARGAFSQILPATVVSVRVAEFAAIANRLEPDGLHEWLNRYYSVVDAEAERHGGVAVQHAGEVVIAVFDAPAAHGEDGLRAVRAAVAIHRALPVPPRVQIGIASGKVLHARVGGGDRHERTIIGNCVALASDLAQAAESGETVVTDDTYRAVAKQFEATPLPLPAATPGSAIQAWCIGAQVHPRGQPLFGRRQELSAFASALEACLENARGQGFLVRGNAGIGKTRLIEEFEALASARGFATHKALVLDFGGGLAHDPIRLIARSLLELTSTSSDQDVQRAAERAVEDGWIAQSQHALLLDLLGLPLPVKLKTVYDAMDSGARERGRQSTLARLFESAAARRPLVVTVEDVQWAEAATLAQLAQIARTSDGCAGILVMSARSEAEPLDPLWRNALLGVALTTIELGALRDADATQLAAGLIEPDSELGTQFIARCVRRAEGNPLFLEQLLRAAGDAREQIPHSVQSIVCARIDHLPPQDRQAAKAAAVMGQRFSLPALRHLIGDPQYTCDRLLAQHLIRPWGDEFLFTHALIAEAIYDALPKSELRRMHCAHADWLADRDPVLVAEHLDRADDPRAAAAYLQAARAQARTYHNDDALRLARRGIGVSRDARDKLELACFEAELLQEAGAIDESIAAYEMAYRHAVTPGERCRTWIGIAAGLRVRDRYAEALELLERAERAATRAEDLALIHCHRGNIMVPMERSADCLESHELALRFAREAGSPLLEARALSGLGDAHYLRGAMRTAGEAFARCIELCRSHGFGRIEVANLAMRGATRFYSNELTDAIADTRAAVELAIEVGNCRAEAIARNVLAYLLYYAGECQAAKEQALHGLELARKLGSKRFEVKNLLNLGLALLGLGQADRARQMLEQAYATGQSAAVGLWAAWVLGALALASDDIGKRAWALSEGQARLSEGSAGHGHLHFYELAMEASLRAGDWRAALDYADRLEDYTRAEPLPWSDFCVARTRALAQHARRGADREAANTLRELARLAQRSGLKLALPALQQTLARSCRPGLSAKR